MPPHPPTCCPTCGHAGTRPFLALDGLPVLVGQLFDRRADAVAAPRGTVRLGFCPACGMVHNHAFNPGLVGYELGYDNALHFSPLFQRYATQLADHLIDAYGLHGKTVVEIGSGDGAFLELLCARGGNRGIGYDPSREQQPATPDPGGNVRFVRAPYAEAGEHERADLVCCRHVLEHLTRPDELLAGIRRALGDHPAALYFEVPDGRYLLANGEPWDVIYDHPAHFSPPVLRHLFQRNGFRVVRLAAAFADQYLQVEAIPAATPVSAAIAAEEVAAVADLVDAFGVRVLGTVSDACRHLDELLTSGAAVALWGAGAKGVTYLNLIDPQGRIPFAVDLNPRKHGMYVPGTGTPILPPEHLRDARPDVVLFTNPIYHAEIQDLLDQLGVPATLELI
jgi:SAM-dependent methyltransferase